MNLMKKNIFFFAAACFFAVSNGCAQTKEAKKGALSTQE
jgi:hypothetical protein